MQTLFSEFLSSLFFFTVLLSVFCDWHGSASVRDPAAAERNHAGSMLSCTFSYSHYCKFSPSSNTQNTVNQPSSQLFHSFRLEASYLELFLVQSQVTSMLQLACCTSLQEPLDLLPQVGAKEELSRCLFVFLPFKPYLFGLAIIHCDLLGSFSF